MQIEQRLLLERLVQIGHKLYESTPESFGFYCCIVCNVAYKLLLNSIIQSSLVMVLSA